jgi:hypothetical protein
MLFEKEKKFPFLNLKSFLSYIFWWFAKLLNYSGTSYERIKRLSNFSLLGAKSFRVLNLY